MNVFYSLGGGHTHTQTHTHTTPKESNFKKPGMCDLQGTKK